jgi:hypothetical protein
VTHLPRLRVYRKALDSAKALALKGCVTDEVNQNLTSIQKLALRFHFRLGHISFQHIQWLGRQGLLGPEGAKMGKTTLSIPKCAACQFGKQGRTPTPGRRVSFADSGALSKDQVNPGQRIFVDQYESRAPGRTFSSKGASSSLKFVGGTLFYDAASGYISIQHQHGFTAAETIQSKIKFEQEALQSGVSVGSFHTDNGVFNAQEFLKEIADKGQGIQFSGVSAHHQNGAAENGIKVVVRNARTMMLHVALRWPGYADQDLWPMAMSHAVHLWNHTPKMATGLAPIEIFSGSKSDCNHLLNAHPWGCPVYVLEPKLRDGHKLPKWEPRSRRGQFMGISPNHASSVHLVRNLQTGTITPQFHLVFDDFFETVFSEGEQEPDVWQDLVVFQSFANDFDDDDYRPELSDEWLNPVELQHRITNREEERNKVLNSLTNQAANRRNIGNQADGTDNRPPPTTATEQPTQTVMQPIVEPVEDIMNVTDTELPIQETITAPIVDEPHRRYPQRKRKPTR